MLVIAGAIRFQYTTHRCYLDRIGGEELYTAKKFRQGGVADYTGIAEVHGSQSSPEVWFNASQAAKLHDLVKTSDSLTDDLNRAANAIRIEILDMKNVFDEFKSSGLLEKVMTQGGMNPNSLNERWKEFIDNFAPNNYTQNNSYGEGNIEINNEFNVHANNEKSEIVDTIRKMIPEINSTTNDSIKSGMRNNGIFNRGSTIARNQI